MCHGASGFDPKVPAVMASGERTRRLDGKREESVWGRVGWECELKMQGVSGESYEAQGGIPGGAPPAPRPRDREYQVFT